MFTKTMRIWFKQISSMTYLPSLSAITFSILQSNFGFIKIITPVLFVESLLKSAFPPHSASQVVRIYVSWRNEKWYEWELNIELRIMDLFNPVTFNDWHLNIFFSLISAKTEAEKLQDHLSRWFKPYKRRRTRKWTFK